MLGLGGFVHDPRNLEKLDKRGPMTKTNVHALQSETLVSVCLYSIEVTG